MSAPTNAFFEKPILNSPYAYPALHWELDESGQPTQKTIESRRMAEFVMPIPKPKGKKQTSLDFGDPEGLSTENQRYEIARINAVRRHVDSWRKLPRNQWKVMPETARLLEHWRSHKFASIRPFFCQVEAAETMIWLTEVAPQLGKTGEQLLAELDAANQEANPGLNRLALKLATGAGKTTVMAMLIAWQTINAVRHPQSTRFTKGFLIIAPGLTIKDRLRVLMPNDPDSYYKSRELVPADMMDDVMKAKIVLTNYHAFKLRERVDISKGTRSFLQGHGPELITEETEGQMIQRVMPELMGMKSIFVLNDEAHHCYREKPQALESDLKGEDKEEAKKNNEAARLWISGIEAVNRKIGVMRVADLSATPFFLRGSGYAEGTLFPWTMSDFSLMDAIESGIVKLPRVPIDDNIPGEEMPMFRNLWKHIGKKMPKKGRGKAGALSVADMPPQLQTALDALYGHYKKTFELWKKEGISVPPCFIVVCNNTASSKLVYDYIAGALTEKDDGSTVFTQGRLPLFQNFDDNGEAIARPRTLLIDSEQLESGDALDASFLSAASDEIARFRREIIERTGDQRAAVTTRSVAILLAERRPAQELCTKYPPGQPPQSPRLLQLKLPNIVVLTTPSPAALGGGGAVRDTVQRQRLELYDPKARPAAIILDPQALATAPLGLFLNAAMATYCGMVEGFLAPALNAFAQADLVQALALSQEHLPRLLRTPDDGTVRVQLAVAGLLRNRASDALAGNGGLLLAAGLVHALQSRYAHFPQGHGIAALLAPALRYTAQVPAPGHASLATAFGLARHGAPDMAAVASASTDFLRQLGVPTRLRELDIPRDGLAAVADVALESYYVRAAPRPLTDRGEALALLEEAW